MEAVMDPAVRTVKDWLQDRTNQYIRIHKEEDGDTDQIRMKLLEIGYRPDRPSIDGYTGGPAFVLHGPGTILANGKQAPLPGDSYVVPIDGLTVTETAEGGRIMTTDRARYSLTAE
ncbi:hypothetical protein [Cohnella caldifontis]|uniref:hypothetical protein n=1 Tax=Cohnella caldifontis TaxID=3027471 RepID=UPI0023EC1F7B|nr:hypothetical protein [Cohnella sp. YIM B05605]